MQDKQKQKKYFIQKRIINIHKMFQYLLTPIVNICKKNKHFIEGKLINKIKIFQYQETTQMQMDVEITASTSQCSTSIEPSLQGSDLTKVPQLIY